MSTTLAGKVALVTGASQGIGLAIADTLACLGMTVWMVARRTGPLHHAAGSINGLTVPFAADLTDPEARARLVSAVSATTAALDVLVNNAGTIHLGRMDEASEDDFADQLAANVLAPYSVTRGFLPLLRGAKGDIIFVNSSAGRTSSPGVGQFSATQHAVRAFADSLRAEVNDDGVRVTVVHPGRTATPRQESIYAHEGRPYDPARLIQPTDVAAIVAAVLLLPRTAEVTDLSIRSMMKP